MAKEPGRRWNPVAAWSGTLLAAGCAFLLLRQTASPAPLGVPLPIPQPKILTKDVAKHDIDTLGKRMPPVWLEFLAPQPDGTSPLHWPYDSQRGGFTIMHPMGALLLEQGGAYFAQTGEDAMVKVDYNQPVKLIKYLMPVRQQGESVTEYVARRRYELTQEGAQIVGGHNEQLKLPRYRFEHFEFTRKDDGVETYHVWYAGPLGGRILVVDFSTRPELIDLARLQIDKIMASFKPHHELEQVMLMEDPTYGELAGTPEVEEALRLKQQWDEQARQAKQARSGGGKASP
jgi:hypothetical protein